MKSLFIHDFRVKHDKVTNIYYSTGFSYQIWNRYLTVFDSLKIISRYERINPQNEDRPLISSGSNVTFSPIQSFRSLTSLIKNFRTIYKQLIKDISDSEAVIIRLPSVLGIMSALICIKLKKKYYVEVVGAMFESYWYYGTFMSKLLAIPADLLQKKAVKQASVVTYITESYLQNKYKTKGIRFDSVSNIILDNEFEDSLRKEEVSNSKKVKIGLVGSTFVKYKGHDTAIKALSLLKRQGYDICLEFVGEGLSDYIDQLIEKYNLSENIRFIGMINDREKLNRWYRSLDIYIQPSKTEGHGRAVVEAISNGVPVLASNKGGLPDSVHRDFLFDSRNESALAFAIKKLINNEGLREININENIAKIKKYKKRVVQQKRIEALDSYRSLILEEEK